jgi:hypothetical protein
MDARMHTASAHQGNIRNRAAAQRKQQRNRRLPATARASFHRLFKSERSTCVAVGDNNG